ALTLGACGGQVVVPASGGAGGAGGHGASAGAGASGGGGGASGAAGAAPDGGFVPQTPCSTPDWEGCGPPDCPAPRPGCSFCDVEISDEALVSPCFETYDDYSFGLSPPDGLILLSQEPDFTKAWNYLPYSAGVMIAAHGQSARLGYADRGVWTGEPLPMPTTCPEIPDVHPCGGYCGGCPVGQLCTGRSPLHPYGLCVREGHVCSTTNDWPCEKGERCFVFTVEPEHQQVADSAGFCLPLAVCQASAAHLPGGGRCE
ncbi:MAG: hypothetical protein OZ928_17615, partial [Polyangiaceae bacterium]|nr:hypothetical protein [Polyangiaceae bacterium]